LLVTTKSSTNAVEVFSVNAAGQLSASPMVNSDGSNDPFSFAFTPNDQVVVAEAGGAGAVDEFQVNSDGSLSPLGSVAGLGAGIEGIAAD
jgi:6-phosphogluconolactonase (cycloisomerase 2 family)